MNLSENLKQIRKDNNLSQEALAEMLGVSRQSVSKWESGTAYPEMDKVLQICKLFNVNLDDLMNEDIKIAKERKENKNNINKFVDEMLEYITKTINMFSTLSFKSKVACLFEQACIITILSTIAVIIGAILGDMLSSIFMYVPYEISNFIKGLLGSIYGIAVFILIVIIWLNLFKSRYLDYYTIINKDMSSKENTLVENEKVEYSNEPKKEPRIIIRDKPSSNNIIFSSLFKICLIFIKMLVLFISLAFIFSIVTFGILIVLAFIFGKATFFFWGAIISLVSLIIINLICLKFAYDFILNRKTRKGLVGIILGVSLLTTGIGIGLFSIDILKVDYIKDIVQKDIVTETINIPIVENTKWIYIYPCDYSDNIECEFIESNENEITIEIERSKYTETNVLSYRGGYNEAEMYDYECSRDCDEEKEYNYQSIDISYFVNEEKIASYLDKVINDLNDYKIYDIKPNKIKIYAPRYILDKMNES